VVDVSANRVTQIKTPDTDGYAAIQVGFGIRRNNRVAKPAAGHFAKAGVDAAQQLKEFTASVSKSPNIRSAVPLARTSLLSGSWSM
jgi:large subunit ribosomal protein L3